MLDLGGEPFEATPDNAELFTFAPWAVSETGAVFNPETRNHVFLTRQREGEVHKGTYVFNPDVVKRLGTLMLQLRFPARLDQTIIPKSDEEAYSQYVMQQLEEAPDYFPEDWDGAE
jgi:hypothetical protein